MMPFVVLHTAEDLAELTNTLRSIGGEIRCSNGAYRNVLAANRFSPKGSGLFLSAWLTLC